MTPDEQPPFSAPWQAQAFALAVHLNEQGVFTWAEWSQALGAERRRSAAAGVADEPEQYYLDWLMALERLLTERGQSTPDEIELLRHAWVAAYQTTPHGAPVHLERGLAELGADGDGS